MPNVYVTVQNMIDGLGAQQLSRILDVDIDFDFETSSMLAQKIAAANAQIDAYVSAGVVVPLSAVPANLVEHGVAIANWFLVASRPEVQRDGDETRYNQAMSYLRDRKGTDLGTVTVVAGARIVKNSAFAVGAKTVRILDPGPIPADERL